MARIRSVHPGQWTDGDFVNMSPLGRLLAIAIRNEADDNGIFRWKPRQIKIRCLPADNCDIGALLQELVDNRQVIRYEVNGEEFGFIRGFDDYQRPRYPTYLYPVPPEPLPKGWRLRDVNPVLKGGYGRKSSVEEPSIDAPIAEALRRDCGNVTEGLRKHCGNVAEMLPQLVRREGEGEGEGVREDLSPDKSGDLPDPLDPYPTLHGFWDPLCEYLTTTHPRIKLPEPKTRGEYDSRKALADLVRLDGFPEREVVDCLEWLFTDPHEDADFWRQQVQGIQPLRKRKTGELSKFGKIHTKWQRAQDRPRSRNRAAEMVYAADDPFAINSP